jgi:hypothetical protein
MRYASEHKERTRARVLEEAVRRYGRKGRIGLASPA